MLNFANTKFKTSANTLAQLPNDSDAEIAFAGRSNSGKSSAINAITRVNNLARTSKTPGRTQLLNYFEVKPRAYMVDLPGYGYAKVDAKQQQYWQELIGSYFETRMPLRGIVLIMDIRHPCTEFDYMLLDFLADTTIPCHILLSKADKLSRSQMLQAIAKVQSELSDYPNLSIQSFSATKKVGIKEAQTVLDNWLNAPPAK